MDFNDYQDFMERFDSSVNMDNYLQRSRIYRMLNNFGLIIKRGLMDPEIFYDGIQGAYIEDIWNKHSVIINEIRKRMNKPHFHEGFEHLAEAMKKVDKKKLRSITEHSFLSPILFSSLLRTHICIVYGGRRDQEDASVGG